MRMLVALLSLVALFSMATAFSTPVAPGLRMASRSYLSGLTMVSETKKAYQQKLGYPAVTAGKTRSLEVTVPKENKKEGWVYREPGEKKEFVPSDAFYARKKQLVKQAPVDVRRYWAAKEGLKNM